jgi:hypothetical protein
LNQSGQLTGAHVAKLEWIHVGLLLGWDKGHIRLCPFNI